MKLTAHLTRQEIDRALEEFVLRETGGSPLSNRSVRLHYSPEAGQREPATYSADIEYIPEARRPDPAPRFPIPRD